MSAVDLTVAAEVAQSPIAGQGIFALSNVARGDRVALFAEVPSGVSDLGTINHSCSPNLGWADERTLLAMHDISAGTELTTDYALVLDSGAALVWCHCGTYRCRQVIEADDWRIPQLQQRYAGYWAPRVAAHIAAVYQPRR